MKTLQAWLLDGSADDERRNLSRRTFLQHSAKVATAGTLAVTLSGGFGLQRFVAAQEASDGIGAPGRQGGEGSGDGEEIDSSADQLEAAADELDGEEGSDQGEGLGAPGRQGGGEQSEGLGAPGRQGGGGGGRRAERGAAATVEGSGNAGLPSDGSGGGQATTMPSSGTGSYFSTESNGWVTGLGLSAVAAAAAAVFSGKRFRATEPVDSSNS